MSHGLSVIVPAFNEEHGLRILLPRLLDITAAASDPSEVIVVDDGSTDATAAIAASGGA